MNDAPLWGEPGLIRTRQRSLVVGVAAVVGCVAAAVFLPGPFFRAYLAAYVFFLGAALGSLALLMLYHLTGGAWGYLIRSALETSTRTLPLLALLFLPIGFGAEYLYSWPTTGAAELAEPGYSPGPLYLNGPFFWIRAGLYFALWIGLTAWLNRLSRREAQDGSPRWTWQARHVSGIGALLFGISIHFSSIDWLLMLDVHFHSTIYPPLVAVSQLTTGMAVALVVLARVGRLKPVSDVVSTKALHDLGSLQMAFVILWAYMNWFQFMLIWMADVPQNAEWFELRSGPGWLAVTWVLLSAGFVVPLLLLLQRAVKGRLNALGATARLILAMQSLFQFYLVLPAHPEQPVWTHWVDVLPTAAIGGLWAAWFLFVFERAPLLPAGDYNRRHVLELRHLDEEEAEREGSLSHA